MPSTSRSARLGPLSIRTRVLLAVSLLSLLSLLLAGAVGYAVERRRIDGAIDDRLAHKHTETVALVERGTDPATGTRITSTSGMLRAAMQLTQANPTEGVVALIDDQVVWTAPPGVRVRPEADPELLTALRATDRDRVIVTTQDTPTADYRAISIPVTVAGDPERGRLVWVIDADAERAEFHRSYRTFLLVGAATLGVVGLVAWLLIGQLLEPIAWVRNTAREINETDLSRRIPVRGTDELADLSQTVNAMLDRLETTFAAQRALYDDVGHELRTPLTVLRGHLEVVDVNDPHDVRNACRRAVSEVERMARLVEDLITLAKSERPDFLRLQAVDVGALTDEILDKATALGPRRWVLADLADVRVLIDPQRISQAVLELARNAVKFSDPGSTIAIGSRADTTVVWWWVRDEGRGIPANRVDHVRTRFARGDDPHTEGSGLGLAIVSSIAEAHGGYLNIQSVHGRGSTISLVLPRKAAGDLPRAEWTTQESMS